MSKNPMNAPKARPAPFGTLLGYAPGGVTAWSSDYKTADPVKYPKRKSFRSYVDGIYMGHKWQCVEFARRWMYVNCGYIFDDVSMAYEIFELRSVRDVSSEQRLPLASFRNGCKRWPEPGALLIWEEGGEFEH
ncbi:MAG: CHAP domain-containing protein, partial [Pseudomonadales bacterium]